MAKLGGQNQNPKSSSQPLNLPSSMRLMKPPKITVWGQLKQPRENGEKNCFL